MHTYLKHFFFFLLSFVNTAWVVKMLPWIWLFKINHSKLDTVGLFYGSVQTEYSHLLYTFIGSLLMSGNDRTIMGKTSYREAS